MSAHLAPLWEVQTQGGGGQSGDVMSILGVGQVDEHRAQADLVLRARALGPQLCPWGTPDHQKALHLAFTVPPGPFRVPYTKGQLCPGFCGRRAMRNACVCGCH